MPIKNLDDIIRNCTPLKRILDVPHRHCVFTVPKEFRKYFYWHGESLKNLQDMAYEVIEEYINRVDAKNSAWEFI